MKKIPLVVLACALVGAGVFVADRFGLLSRPTRAARAAPPGQCQHGLPEASCPFCHPDLVEQAGLCGEHGIPEALCTRCKPALIAVFKSQQDWCDEHQLPESLDELCHPGVLAKYESEPEVPSTSAFPISLEPAAPDDVPRIQGTPSLTCTKDRNVIRLESVEIARRIGLESEPIRREALHQTLLVNAEVVYDATKFARLSSRAPGVITDVRKNVGEAVSQGEVLAVVDSGDLGSAKAALLDALATVRLWERNDRREQALLEQGIATEREALETATTLTESRIELARAHQRLRSLGLSEPQIETLLPSGDASSTLELTAPFAGLVVERTATLGEVVDMDTAKPLLAVADTRRMWAVLDLAQAHVPQVQVGQTIVLTIDGLRGESFAGRIAALGSEVDPRTRTIKARAEVENERGLLRANSFGRAEISIRNGESALLVPKAAVQWDGCCNVVFVGESQIRFRPRKLRLGCESGDFYEVLEGLKGDEAVVTQGSFLLKTEILKGSIGAGCCQVEQLAK